MLFDRRRWRYVGYLVGIVFATSIPAAVSAGTLPSTTVSFSSTTVVRSQTLTLSQYTKAIIAANAMVPAGTVTFARTDEPLPPLPPDQKLHGKPYRLTATGVTAWPTDIARPAYVQIRLGTTYNARNIWIYDHAKGAWKKLATKIYPGRNVAVAVVRVTDATVVVLEDLKTQIGIASWYCKNSCSSRYPTLHGTSNHFPIGSMVKVTNTLNNKSVTVKIISRWGQPAGRVVDLSWAAFAKIKDTNGGLIKKVTVTSRLSGTSSTSVPATKIPAAPAADPATAGAVARITPGGNPGSSVAAYTVMDEKTGKILAEKMSTTPRSIASITKLMTAAIVLDTKVDLAKRIIYSKSDATAYGYLRLQYGDDVSMYDLLGSLLVGSANNAATALVRGAGLTQAEAVAKMNAKAAAWGLTQTHFVDVHGLGVGNTSTSHDIAKMARKLFVSYPRIRAMTSMLKYDFVVKNTGVPHYIKTTDGYLTSTTYQSYAEGLKFAGAKTGFIDEALYTYVIRFIAPNGAKIIVSILGADTAAVRYGDAAKLAAWAWKEYTWTE